MADDGRLEARAELGDPPQGLRVRRLWLEEVDSHGEPMVLAALGRGARERALRDELERERAGRARESALRAEQERALAERMEALERRMAYRATEVVDESFVTQ